MSVDDLTTGVTNVSQGRSRPHKVPRMPIKIDGETADPRDVRYFIDSPLHTVVDSDTFDGKMLHLFTDQAEAKRYAETLIPHFAAARKEREATLAGRATASLTPGVPVNGGYIELYEHVDFSGALWRLYEANYHTVGDYSKLIAWVPPFWWGNANNTVSSMDVRVSANFAIFFDGVALDGGDFSNALIIPGNSWLPDLTKIGWNDRISSHLLWY